MPFLLSRFTKPSLQFDILQRYIYSCRISRQQQQNGDFHMKSIVALTAATLFAATAVAQTAPAKDAKPAATAPAKDVKAAPAPAKKEEKKEAAKK